MVDLSYCCEGEITCSCNIGKGCFICDNPHDINICPKDCEIKQDIVIKKEYYSTIYGIVKDKCGHPVKNVVVKLFRERWICGSAEYVYVSSTVTDSCGFYEFILPNGSCKVKYKVVVTNESVDNLCSHKPKDCYDNHCDCSHNRNIPKCKEYSPCNCTQEKCYSPKETYANGDVSYGGNCYAYRNNDYQTCDDDYEKTDANKTPSNSNNVSRSSMTSSYYHMNKSYYNK